MIPTRFFEGPRSVQRTSQGLVDLPIHYYEASNVVALFDVEVSQAEKLLEGTGLEPAVFGKSAIVGLSFYEYRHTSVGVYNEVGTAIFALPLQTAPPRFPLLEMLKNPRRRRVGAYVVDLPVTTPLANAAGREIWGYPKFVTQIPFELGPRRFSGSVLDPDDGSLICSLKGELKAGIGAPPLSLMTYTLLDQQLVRTSVDVRGRVKLHRGHGLAFEVGKSRHRMAENLRTLGLAEANPRIFLTTDRFQSLLHPGTRAR